MMLVSLRHVTGSLVLASCTPGQVMLPICTPGHIMVPPARSLEVRRVENKALLQSSGQFMVPTAAKLWVKSQKYQCILLLVGGGEAEENRQLEE